MLHWQTLQKGEKAEKPKNQGLILHSFIKGSDRLCKVVELRMQCHYLIIKKTNSENVSNPQSKSFERRICAQTQDLQLSYKALKVISF